eukprot:scaffold17923_cov18-Tisochrysis_lutea.AAC.1
MWQQHQVSWSAVLPWAGADLARHLAEDLVCVAVFAGQLFGNAELGRGLARHLADDQIGVASTLKAVEHGGAVLLPLHHNRPP